MKTVLRLAVLLVLVALSATSLFAQSDSEKQIRAAIDNVVKAINAKDVDKVMEFYDHSPRLVAFDVVPPLQYVGWDAYKKDYEEFFAMFDGPLTAEAADLVVVADGNMGYSHNTERMSGTLKSGGKMDIVLRVTDVYRKINGKWVVVHEHASVPVDLETGKAVLQAK